MRAAEFMRTLADLIDQLENKTDDTKSSESETPMDSGDIMVPPLQQKIELMKKMTSTDDDNFNTVAAEEDEPFEG
jgi:hypothetical protein